MVARFQFGSSLPATTEAQLLQLENFAQTIDWTQSLWVWRLYHPQLPSAPRHFAIRCNRVGKHAFGSPEAAARFGSGVVASTLWAVDLTHPDYEVLLNIIHNEVAVLLFLSPALDKRLTTVFGRTTLRGSVSYSLARLASIGQSDVVYDAFCGSGALLLETRARYSSTFCLGSDLETASLAAKNLLLWPRSEARGTLSDHWTKHHDVGQLAIADVFTADARRLPLRDRCCDVILCDLPFGKKCGSAAQNRIVYPDAVQEFARVLRPGGRAVLLTRERGLLQRVLDSDQHFDVLQRLPVEMGGLILAVFLLRRKNQD